MDLFELIILPVLVPIVSGGIGLITLPYIRKITQAIGNVIHSFTDLNPLLMSILISVAFSLLMVTPISLVAIATAISLNGLGSGAANLGIVAACVFISLMHVGIWCKCSFTHRSCKNDDPSLLEKFNYFDTIDYKWNNYWNHCLRSSG